MPTDCISFRDTAFVSKLICDYVENRPELQMLYHRFPTIENFKAQLEAKQAEFNFEKRANLVAVLTEQYAPLSPSELTTKVIKSLADENTFTVTTGHQLNLLGGPLYFLYKIITTINLAKELKHKYPNNKFVPVFWMASEDHDFEEINHFNFQNKRFQWTQQSSGAVGSLATSGLAEFVKVFSDTLGNSTHAIELKELVKNAYLNHSNLASATRYLVHTLFGSEGLLIIDGNNSALKRLFIPQITSELTNQQAFTSVSKTNNQLTKIDAAYKVQVNPRELNLFYLKENLRERIVKKAGVYSFLNTDISWDLAGILEEVNAHPERFSPNVIMRPLYQETILPNLCYIGGGGELAYWMQLKGYFETVKIPFPSLLLRNSVQIVSHKQVKQLQNLDVSFEEMFLRQHLLIAKKIKEKSDIKFNFEDATELLTQQFLALRRVANETDSSFIGAVDAQQRKQLKGLNNLEKRLLRAEKRKHFLLTNRIKSLQDQLLPNKTLEERHRNFSDYYLIYGQELIISLKESLKPLQQAFTILEL